MEVDDENSNDSFLDHRCKNEYIFRFLLRLIPIVILLIPLRIYLPIQIGELTITTTTTTSIIQESTSTRENSTTTAANNCRNHHNIQQQQLDHHQPRIVLLVGPHKTGSTSIQTNFYNWIHSKNRNFSGNWVWPLPPSVRKDYEEKHLSPSTIAKNSFYDFVDTIIEPMPCQRPPNILNATQCDELREAYKQGFHQQFVNNQKSLLIASEGLDLAMADPNYSTKNPSQNWYITISRLLEQFPIKTTTTEGEEEDVITVVVNYRSPRVEHLISTWHQCCLDYLTFEDYLMEKHLRMRNIDSLYLAELYSRHDVQVILIDLSGLKSQNYDVSNIIACDILQFKCHPDKTIVMSNNDYSIHNNATSKKNEDGQPIIANVKSGQGTMGTGVTKDILDQIETLIRRRDCQFVNLSQASNVEILYGEDLLEIWNHCIQQHDQGISLREMKHQIKKLIST